jgi:putative FmdB family regulatory protein
MPLYEYKCDRCGNVFELIQKFSDAPLEQHENCGGHLEKLLSTSALQFKGTGWYVTDYARKTSNGKAANKGESKDKDSGGKESGSKDSGAKDSGDKSAKTESSKSSAPASSSTSSSSDKK